MAFEAKVDAVTNTGTELQQLQRRIARETVNTAAARGKGKQAALDFVATTTGLSVAQVEKLLAPAPRKVTVTLTFDVADYNPATITEDTARNAIAYLHPGAVVPQSVTVKASAPVAKKAPAKKAAAKK